MTLETLAQLICLTTAIFGRGSPSPSLCERSSSAILAATSETQIDPLLVVAVNIQECDLREDVVARWSGGVDACPMGLRIRGKFSREEWPIERIYREAVRKMVRDRQRCKDLHHRGHHFIKHWNNGNPVYANQVLATYRYLSGKKVSTSGLVPRTLEILRRMGIKVKIRQS
jgi:hypothetical protein